MRSAGAVLPCPTARWGMKRASATAHHAETTRACVPPGSWLPSVANLPRHTRFRRRSPRLIFAACCDHETWYTVVYVRGVPQHG